MITFKNARKNRNVCSNLVKKKNTRRKNENKRKFYFVLALIDLEDRLTRCHAFVISTRLIYKRK